MHTVACAQAHAAECSCECNHTLHGYLNGVLSTEQHRRVRDSVTQGVSAATGPDAHLHVEGALRELDALLGEASAHLAKGTLTSENLHTLVNAVVDAAAEQQQADISTMVAAEADAAEAAALATEEAALEAELATEEAALEVEVARANEAEARAAQAAAEVETVIAQVRQEQAESVAARALGRLHLMCGLCATAAERVAAQGDAVLGIADFLDSALGPNAVVPLAERGYGLVREAMSDVLGEDVSRVLLKLGSLPTEIDLKVLAIAFCPDPTEHPAVAGFQADLTTSVVLTITTGG